jgi:hypothetical protein
LLAGELLVVERGRQPFHVGPLPVGGTVGEPRQRLIDELPALVAQQRQLLRQVVDDPLVGGIRALEH